MLASEPFADRRLGLGKEKLEVQLHIECVGFGG